jgi:hypothetical protein
VADLGSAMELQVCECICYLFKAILNENIVVEDLLSGFSNCISLSSFFFSSSSSSSFPFFSFSFSFLFFSFFLLSYFLPSFLVLML